MDLGYWTAHTRGLGEARVREVPRRRDSDAFTPLERDVLEYAEAMTQTPPTVTDALSARLGPYRRERPRDPVEAEFLRSIGTSERLIGPSR